MESLLQAYNHRYDAATDDQFPGDGWIVQERMPPDALIFLNKRQWRR
jgi:hypothetical protein